MQGLCLIFCSTPKDGHIVSSQQIFGERMSQSRRRFSKKLPMHFLKCRDAEKKFPVFLSLKFYLDFGDLLGEGGRSSRNSLF